MMNKLKDSHGQAIVEFAVVMPMFMLLLFAVLDMGNVMLQRYKTQAAAYEGARFCALYEGDDLSGDLNAFISEALGGAETYRGVSPENADAESAYISGVSVTDDRVKITVTYNAKCLTYVTRLIFGPSVPITRSGICAV